MAEIYTVARQQRAAILARERQAASELVRAYGTVWQQIQIELERLTTQIEFARQAGEEISPAWLFRQNRLRSLQNQVNTEVSRLTNQVLYPSIISSEMAAIDLAQQHALELLGLATGATRDQLAQLGISFTRLPVGAIEAQVGFLANGSPLQTLLATLGPEAALHVGNSLISAVALGYNPRKTARMIRDDLGGNMTRALRIARNETLRSYREAAQQVYEANSDVVGSWRWQCSFSLRTCPLCIAMSGTIHPVTETLASHICCRCVQVPVTKSWEELGITGVPDTRPPAPESGESWFARQSDADQRHILGPERYEAYRNGQLTLKDMVGYKVDPEWGASRYIIPLGKAANP